MYFRLLQLPSIPEMPGKGRVDKGVVSEHGGKIKTEQESKWRIRSCRVVSLQLIVIHLPSVWPLETPTACLASSSYCFLGRTSWLFVRRFDLIHVLFLKRPHISCIRELWNK